MQITVAAKWIYPVLKAIVERPVFLERHLKQIVEGFLETSEADPAGDRPADRPAWVSVVLQLAERVDNLQAEVDRLKSFIRAEERPPVGEAPVDRSKAK